MSPRELPSEKTPRQTFFKTVNNQPALGRRARLSRADVADVPLGWVAPPDENEAHPQDLAAGLIGRHRDGFRKAQEAAERVWCDVRYPSAVRRASLSAGFLEAWRRWSEVRVDQRWCCVAERATRSADRITSEAETVGRSSGSRMETAKASMFSRSAALRRKVSLASLNMVCSCQLDRRSGRRGPPYRQDGQ
jgi:hypothetical protein